MPHSAGCGRTSPRDLWGLVLVLLFLSPKMFVPKDVPFPIVEQRELIGYSLLKKNSSNHTPAYVDPLNRVDPWDHYRQSNSLRRCAPPVGKEELGDHGSSSSLLTHRLHPPQGEGGKHNLKICTMVFHFLFTSILAPKYSKIT